MSGLGYQLDAVTGREWLLNKIRRRRKHWRSVNKRKPGDLIMVKTAKATKRRKRVSQADFQAVQNQLEQAKAEAAGLREQVQELTTALAPKAVDQGPVFELKAKDSAAPDTIRFWAKRAAAAGASAAKVGGAMLIADEMEFWQSRNGRKVAD